MSDPIPEPLLPPLDSPPYDNRDLAIMGLGERRGSWAKRQQFRGWSLWRRLRCAFTGDIS